MRSRGMHKRDLVEGQLWGGRYCCVIAAGVGIAAVGAVASNSAAKKNASAANKATAAQENIGMAQLAESTRQFDIQNERAARTDALTDRVTNAQLEAMQKNTALADDYNRYNQTVFRPLETGLVREAEQAGSLAEQDAAAGRAGASVRTNFMQAQDASARNLARMGISANSGRALAVNANLGNNIALGAAAAENGARDQARQLGFAKRMDAASLGRNLPSAQATSSQIANNSGNSAVNNNLASNSSFNAGANSAGSFLNSAGNTFSSAASGFRANPTSGVGDLLAGGAGMALRYGNGGGFGSSNAGTINQGFFANNSTGYFANPNASEFNRIASTYDP